MVRHYEPLVRAVVARMVPTVDRDDAVQDGLLEVLQRHRQFDPTRGVDYDYYIRVRLKFAVIDGYRKRNNTWRVGERPVMVPSHLVAEVPVDVGVDDVLLAEDFRDWLPVVFDDPRVRRIVRQLLAGVSHRDIAKLEHVTEGRICQIVSEVRARTRRELRRL